MAYETILFEREDNVATITLNRPQAMNSLTDELVRDMAGALESCERDRDVRAVVITATGRAFCAGADISLVAKLDRAGRDFYQLASDAHTQIVEPVRRMAKPVIAAVNGVAAGGGLGLALCCDLRIAAAEARFTSAYSNIALSPDCSTTYALARVVGASKAFELYLFNEVLSAEQALSLGIVYKVVPGADLASTTREIAKRLAAGPSFAYGQTKLLLNRAPDTDLATQLQDEARCLGLCAETEDFRIGLEAFRAKQQANFTGR